MPLLLLIVIVIELVIKMRKQDYAWDWDGETGDVVGNLGARTACPSKPWRSRVPVRFSAAERGGMRGSTQGVTRRSWDLEIVG